MKNLYTYIIVFLLLLLPFGIVAKEHDKTSVLQAGQTVTGNYFGIGSDVRIDGTVVGDAYAAGGTVTVNGRIDGDLLVAGGTVTVNGDVTQDIRVAGGTVILDGAVGRNVSVAGGTVTIGKSARITGGVVAGTGSFSQQGSIGRDLTIGGGTITLANKIGGNVNAHSDQLTFASGSAIAGNVWYTSAAKADVESGATISGTTNYTAAPVQPRRESNQDRTNGGFIIGKIFSLIAMFIIGLLFMGFAPRFTERVVKTVKTNIWKSVLVGFLILVLTPGIMIFLLVTLIGIPFAVGLFFWYLLVLYIGKLFVAMYIGSWVFEKLHKKASSEWKLFVGLLLHLLLTLVPVLGWLVGTFIMMWGAGALVLTKKETYTLWRKKDLL